jgi:hypothetical protein
MRKMIHHIRKQPEQIRRHILHVSTMVCGVFLVLLWIYSLGTNLVEEDVSKKANKDLKPLSALKANIVGGYESIILQPQ